MRNQTLSFPLVIAVVVPGAIMCGGERIFRLAALDH
jgi:hypothetical protein